MRNQWNTCAAVVAALAIGWAAGAAGPATQPAQSEADAALLGQLQAPDWHARRSAESALMGRADHENLDAIESEVRAMFARATLPEAKIRLNRVLDHIEAARLMQPTLVTIHMHDAPAK